MKPTGLLTFAAVCLPSLVTAQSAVTSATINVLNNLGGEG